MMESYFPLEDISFVGTDLRKVNFVRACLCFVYPWALF